MIIYDTLNNILELIRRTQSPQRRNMLAFNIIVKMYVPY